MSSNISRDVVVNISVPCGDGGDGGSKQAAPFVASAAQGELAKQALVQTKQVLDTLHKAVRAGQLTDRGLEDLETFQCFFVDLKAQVERPPPTHKAG